MHTVGTCGGAILVSETVRNSLFVRVFPDSNKAQTERKLNK